MAFGLGRGLESLIPSKPTALPRREERSVSAGKPHEVAISDLVPNPRQPRSAFPIKELEDLAQSIKTHGIIEPLVVSPGTTTGQYILVAGERRLRAAELAGLAKVPVIVRETNDREKLEIALIENIQRQDLNPLEEAKALKQLLEDFNLSQEEVARRIGRKRPTVTNSLRLLELSTKCQQALLAGRISAGHARAILACPSHSDQESLLEKVEELHLSVRQIERLASQTARNAGIVKAGGRPSRDAQPASPANERAARLLGRKLGTRVQVVTAPNGGRIVIEYYSDEERERLVRAILGKSANQPAASSIKFTV